MGKIEVYSNPSEAANIPDYQLRQTYGQMDTLQPTLDDNDVAKLRVQDLFA